MRHKNAFNIVNDLTHFLNKENSWNIQNINKHILSQMELIILLKIHDIPVAVLNQAFGKNALMFRVDVGRPANKVGA